MPSRITSTDNPRVKALVRLLREHRERRRTRLFVAEGWRQVQRALAAGLSLHELYHCPELADTQGLQAWNELSEPIRQMSVEVTQPVLRKMAYRENPEDVLAVFAQPTWSLQQPNWLQSKSASTPTSIATSSKSTNASLSASPPSAPLLLVAMGTSKPGNLGAMARTAAAAGACALLVADGLVDAFNPNAIHASTGAVFTLPVLGGTSHDILDFLQAQKIRIVAAVVTAKQSYTQANLIGPVALTIGSEDKGLSDLWREAAQKHGQCVTIPMADAQVDSLNASNAAAILLFEAVRQRRSEK